MPARDRRRALGLGIALACTAAFAVAGDRAAGKPGAQRHDDVRVIAKPYCGSCHQSSLPTAKPAALAIFDLDQDKWADGMTKKQRECFMGRIKGKLEAAELEKIRAFVAELPAR